jgi:hypothetical protein
VCLFPAHGRAGFFINIKVPVRVFQNGNFVENLIIVTPMNTDRLRNRVLEYQSKKELSSKNVQGVYFQDRSEDIFGAFREMADATGGFVDSSANPVSS